MSSFPTSSKKLLNKVIDTVPSHDDMSIKRALLDNYSSLNIVSSESKKHYPDVTRIITIGLADLKESIINREHNTRDENITILRDLSTIAFNALKAGMNTVVDIRF